MRRLSALLPLISFLPLTAQLPAATSLVPEDLLRRAHALSVNLPPVNRAWLVAMVLGKATMPPQPEMHEWAEEAFKLSLQLPLDKRDVVQSSAISMMARFDPDRALAMLNQMEVAPSNTMRSRTAAQVLSAMLRIHGNAVLPELLAAVNRLSAGNSYPFFAVSALMRAFTAEQREAVLLNAVNAYEHSNPSVAVDSEFVQFLNIFASRLSGPTAKDAAARITIRLLRYADANPECGYNLRFFGEKGIGILDCGDAILWEALPALTLMDKARADGLIATRRALQQPMLSREQGAWTRMQKPSPTISEEEKLAGYDESSRVRQMARTDLDRALQMLPEIKDSRFRMNSLSLITMELADKNPSRARQLLNDVLAKLPTLGDDYEWKITILSNVATTAAKLHDTALLEQTIKNVFALGPRFIEESRKIDPDKQLVRAYNSYKMSTVAYRGALAMPQVTLEQINLIADEETRAYLLLNMVDALTRPPVKK